MIASLIEFDKWLFLLLNGWHLDMLDPIMEGISSRFLWIPLYAFLLYAIIRKYRIKSLYIILFVVLLITLCDQLSVQLFKNNFERLRPCHDPSIQALVHLVNSHCGGQFGFVSSHATNVFGLAVFIGKLLRTSWVKWPTILLVWAIIVSYSRIYLGVHFPFDIIGGGIFGSLIALFVYQILKIADARFELKILNQ